MHRKSIIVLFIALMLSGCSSKDDLKSIDNIQDLFPLSTLQTSENHSLILNSLSEVSNNSENEGWLSWH